MPVVTADSTFERVNARPHRIFNRRFNFTIITFTPASPIPPEEYMTSSIFVEVLAKSSLKTLTSRAGLLSTSISELTR